VGWAVECWIWRGFGVVVMLFVCLDEFVGGVLLMFESTVKAPIQNQGISRPPCWNQLFTKCTKHRLLKTLYK
jgi:hypothetical protein